MRLAYHPPIRDGESLAGFIARLSRANHTPSGRTALRYVQSFLDGGSLVRPIELKTLEIVEQITGTPTCQLYKATPHVYSDFLNLKKPKFLKSTDWPMLSRGMYNNYMRDMERVQYCPLCLKEDAFHRLCWVPKFSFACVKHGVFLIERCYQCQRQLIVGDIPFDQCCKCKARLSNAPTINAGRFIQRTIWLWLRLKKKEYFSVLNGLARTIALRADISVLESAVALGDCLPPYIVERLYTIAFAAIEQWPHHFDRFIDYYHDPDESGVGGRYQYLYQIVNDRWSDLPHVQRAFEDHIVKSTPTLTYEIVQTQRYRTKPDFASRFEHVTLDGAAEMLGICHASIRKLVDAGRIDTTPVGNENDYILLVQRTQVEAILHERAGLSTDDVAEQLQTHRRVISALVSLGKLDAIRGPDVDGHKQYVITQEVVDGFMGELEELSHIQIPTIRVTSFTDALLTRTNKQRRKVLEAIWGSNIAVYHDSKGIGFAAFWLRHAELVRYLPYAKSEVVGHISFSETARQLHTSYPVLRHLVALELIVAVEDYTGRLWFARDEISRFVYDYVPTAKAAEILGIKVIDVKRWSKWGRLHPITGPMVDGFARYLFRRDEIEQFRPSNRVTVKQLAQELNLTPAAIIGRIKRGTLKPVSGPNIDQAASYLFLKEYL